MAQNVIGWYSTVRNGMGLDGLGWDGVAQNVIGQYGTVRDGMGWDGMGQHCTVWDSIVQ